MYADDPWARCERLLAEASATRGQGEDPEFDDQEEDEDQPCTAEQLFARSRPALPTGLGLEADNLLFGGGLRAGEIVEIFGPPGIGKTQLAVSVAAQCAVAGRSVLYASSKDDPLDLASRLCELLAARGGLRGGPRLEAALASVRVVAVGCFTQLARLVAAEEVAGIAGGAGADLLVVDAVSSLLAPFTAAVGGASQPALGPMWAAAASTRLELGRGAPGFAADHGTAAQHLTLTLRKSARLPDGTSLPLRLDAAGVHGPSPSAE